MGVLSGVRIVEVAGIGPAPFAGCFCGHGAEVILLNVAVQEQAIRSNGRQRDRQSRQAVLGAGP